MTSLDDERNGDDVPTNFIEELYDKFLECRLCSRTFRNPKMLVCQHTFCADCLEAHYEMDEQDRPYRFLLSHNRDLSCPCCRTRTPLPSGGIWRLPDNFLIANLTDVIRRRGATVAAKSSGGGCEICRQATIVSNDDQSGSVEDSRQQTATVKCVDCDKLLCADCAELHRETKVTASHVLFTIGDNRDVQCKIHRNETLRFYCEPCEQCVCVLCALHEHNEHEVSSLADGLERHRGTFDALLNDCKTRVDTMRQQIKLADMFQSSLNAAEDNIRHAAIDAIAAVRQRERDLLNGLRSFVGDDTVRFLGERNDLSVRLSELDSVRETTESMVGRTNVELLITKKEVYDRLRTALERHQIQTPDRVRIGGVSYVAGAIPFHDLNRPTADVGKLFRCGVDGDDVRGHVAENHVTDKSSSSSSSSDSDSDSDDSDDEEEPRQFGTVSVVSELPDVEHVDLVARSSDESETSEDTDDDDDDSDDKSELPAPVTKICIDDGVVRRIVIRSESLRDATPPPPQPSGKKIPDFSRPKPEVKYVDRGTEMRQVETTDSGTAMPRVVFSDKETYTGYVCLVHKNVSTDNQGTAEKGTSTTTDVTAAYRNVSNSGRPVTCTRGTNTLKAVTSDRALSPIAALRPPSAPTNPQTAVTKVPAYPTNQKPGIVHVPLTTQKSDTVSVTTFQTLPSTSVAPADAQKAPGAVNMAQRMPQVTTPTSATASALPVSATMSSLTTSQKQTVSAASPAVQTEPTSSKVLPYSQKLVTSSSVVSAPLPTVAATASSQTVTSPTPGTTSPVVVSTPSQQKLPPASTSVAATTSVMRINSPPAAVASAITATTVTSTTLQKPVTSPNASISPSAQSSTVNAAPQAVPSTGSSQSVNNNRIQTAPLNASVVAPPVVTHPGKQAANTAQRTTQATSPTSATASVQPVSPTTSILTTSQKQAVVSPTVQTQPSPSASSTVPTPVAATAVTSQLPASTQKLLTQPQSSLGKPQPAALSQSPVDTALLAQRSQPVTTSNFMQQRPTSTAQTASVQQKSAPLTSQSTQSPTTPGVNTIVAATPSTQTVMTSAFSQSQPTSNTSPISVTSTTSAQTQPPGTAASNAVPNPMYVSIMAQKPDTSSVLPTTQPQWPTNTAQSVTSHSVSSATMSVPTVSTTPAALSSAQMSAQKPLTSSTAQSQHPTTAQSVTPQVTTTHNVTNATTSVPVASAVSTSAQNLTTAAALSSAQTSAHKSMTSSTTQSQHPTTAQSVTSQVETSSIYVSNAAAATSVPPLMATQSMTTTAPSTQNVASPTAHKLMTSDNGQPEAVTSAENSAGAAMTSPVTSHVPVSPSTRPRKSVFRSMSMENIRTPAPVLRPPPPIMTTSVAAVTQRLNGGAGNNGSAKTNGWRSNNR